MRRLSRSSLGAVVLGAVVLASACDDAGSTTASKMDGGSTPSGIAPLEDSPPALISPSKRRDASSSPVVFDSVRGGVWTANGDVGSISYVDVSTPKVVQEVPVGKTLTSVALSPDARWIAAVDRDGAGVALIDAESRVLERTIALGTHPRAAVWDAWDPRWLYVSVEDDAAIAVIDRTRGVLVKTIPIGRIPAGLGVSRLRHELSVLHRIDARVTILSLDGAYFPGDSQTAPAEVSLEDQASDPDPKVPQGKPFAFESLAWAPDGNVVWLPHELFAPTHPIQFQTTVFPAVSVVDLAARAEVETDPTTGFIGGRKLLFDAINLLDATSNPSIISQPCAAAFHPNGLMAYALACGSEDFLTFNAIDGVATDLLRDLPGDHPVGLALDDAGARAFVLSDQSHSLLVIDTAGGSPVMHPRIVGPAISLVAKDPVDPEMREGLKLFFRANSAKGTLATSGNDWMSCAACHLDGFVGTNQFLFEAAKVADPTVDAQIGHGGLKDLFSTAPDFAAVNFDPHDVLVAFADQGGLAPDRTGAHRDGALDPSAPTSEARTMAQRVARVIARDLPLGPTWLLPGGAPDANYDGAWCGNCHEAEFQAWQKSAHAHAGEDPMMRFGAGVEVIARGPQYTRLCAGCHDPVSARLGDSSLKSGRGITCLGCHDVTRLLHAGGNGDLEASAHTWNTDHKARGLASLETLRKPEFCGGCHQQFVPATGLDALSTLEEWTGTRYAQPASGEATTTCVSCHMPASKGIADHGAVGGNVYLATKYGDAAFIDATAKKLKTAITLEPSRSFGFVDITVRNQAGHSFPTGVSDIREAWIELQAMDAGQKVLARFGGPSPGGLIAPSSLRFGMDIAKADGTVLFLHELSETTRIPFNRRVPGGGSMDVFMLAPASLPDGTVELDAVLMYRNVRTPYFRAATGDSAATAPETEMARAIVPD